MSRWLCSCLTILRWYKWQDTQFHIPEYKIEYLVPILEYGIEYFMPCTTWRLWESHITILVSSWSHGNQFFLIFIILTLFFMFSIEHCSCLFLLHNICLCLMHWYYMWLVGRSASAISILSNVLSVFSERLKKKN